MRNQFTRTGVPSGNVAVMPGHPSVKSFTSGNASGNYYLIELRGYGRFTDTFANLGSGRDVSSCESYFIVQVDNAAAVVAVSNRTTCFGFMNMGSTCADAGGPGIAVVTNSGSATNSNTGTWSASNWVFVTSLPDPLSNFVDTEVAANSATRYHSKIYNPPSGSVKLARNGVESSTDVPASPLLTWMTIFTRTSASNAEWADYFSFRGRGLAR
jgi:hypothetical protein